MNNSLETSSETRWFVSGQLLEETKKWFFADKQLAVEERTDRYLLLPGCESASVKIRDYKNKFTLKVTQNFEIKALKGEIEIAKFSGGVSGRISSWVKWSVWDESAIPLIQTVMALPSGWVDVTKRRWLRKFSINNGLVKEVGEKERPDQGGNVELTELNANGQTAWSHAFETFGDPNKVRIYLESLTYFFFSHHDPVDLLNTVNSCAYPTWLASLGGTDKS